MGHRKLVTPAPPSVEEYGRSKSWRLFFGVEVKHEDAVDPNDTTRRMGQRRRTNVLSLNVGVRTSRH
jgi:hypothetical protein